MNNIRWQKVSKRKWSKEEDGKFIQVWASKHDQLCGPTKNSLIYNDMVAELASMGIEVTKEQVRYKILNLIKKHRNLKKDYDPDYPFGWPFYKEVDALIGTHPVYKNKIITSPELANNIGSRINVEQDYATFEVDTLELTTIKDEEPTTPPMLEEPLSDCSMPESSNRAIPNSTDELNTAGERLEQGLAALLTACNRLSENMEFYLALEKQKMKELRDIRLATTKLCGSFAHFLKSNRDDFKYKYNAFTPSSTTFNYN